MIRNIKSAAKCEEFPNRKNAAPVRECIAASPELSGQSIGWLEVSKEPENILIIKQNHKKISIRQYLAQVIMQALKIIGIALGLFDYLKRIVGSSPAPEILKPLPETLIPFEQSDFYELTPEKNLVLPAFPWVK